MKKIISGLAVVFLLLGLTGCTILSSERVKLKDLDFTVLGQEKIPGELMSIIEEKKGEPFQITFHDKDFLYICIGYGKQETGGYSIAVNELCLTDTAVCVNTSLLGPKPEEQNQPQVSFPFIVLKTEFLDLPVVFE